MTADNSPEKFKEPVPTGIEFVHTEGMPDMYDSLPQRMSLTEDERLDSIHQIVEGIANRAGLSLELIDGLESSGTDI